MKLKLKKIIFVNYGTYVYWKIVLVRLKDLLRIA